MGSQQLPQWSHPWMAAAYQLLCCRSIKLGSPPAASQRTVQPRCHQLGGNGLVGLRRLQLLVQRLRCVMCALDRCFLRNKGAEPEEVRMDGLHCYPRTASS